MQRSFGLSFLLAIATLTAQAETALDYPTDIKSTIEQRCMVCHGCYDAPCQLKLDAFMGLERGANKQKVYDGTRLITANLTRLYEDAQSTEEWREKGFYRVLDSENPAAGTLYKMLALKQAHPLPIGPRLPDSFDFGLDRDQQCPKPRQFERYATEYPLWGMPYGFPGLDSARQARLVQWLESGAQGVAVAPRPADESAAIERWEEFFNGRSLKEQLMARYIYEHLFIGNLHIDDLERPSAWYKLVRSLTPSGEPIRIIASRRPYDDPGEQAFYYRLQRRDTAILDKRHMPYALNNARMLRWSTLFLNPYYAVTTLPDYDLDASSNPFITFAQLPVNSRYRFMLEEAHFTIMGFIKGPVCRGQVALNVIDDHFWVSFLQPSVVDPAESSAFLKRESANLRLPTGKDGLLISLVEWRQYAERQKQLVKARAQYFLGQKQARDIAVNVDVIWDGDGDNDNAALTVFRHNDSASVVKGFVGETPKTAWVIDYSLLERIHYLLVAGFDVYGNAGHQLESRLYMDFLRMEGEQNFLTFLPEASRNDLRDFWYRGAQDHVKDFVADPETSPYEIPTAIKYRSSDPKKEFLAMLRARLPAANAPRYALDRPLLQELQELQGSPFSYLPEASFLQVLDSRGKASVYTILRNSAHTNNAQIFNEEERRIPEEDNLTIVKGFIGSYPNIFFQVNERELPGFTQAIVKLDSEESYSALVQRYGVPRNASWFWKISDSLYQAYTLDRPVQAGLFDLNRYENR
jgi:hypothetical protein